MPSAPVYRVFFQEIVDDPNATAEEKRHALAHALAEITRIKLALRQEGVQSTLRPMSYA